MDDIVIKSPRMEDYAKDLAKSLDTLRKMRLKLNPMKCTFRVFSGKFLGHVIFSKGSYANPVKVNILTAMKSSIMVKEIQALTGRIAVLSRFLFRSADRHLPFFQVLKQATRFQWTPECEKTF